MDTARKKEIKNKAREVTSVSEQYQLIHATYACQTLIKQIVVDDFKEKYDELSKQIEEKMTRALDYKEELKEKERLDMLIQQKAFHIDVAYIDTNTEDAARVIKIDNAFVINISKSLANQIFDKSGQYNYDVIRKIRKLMSHELGHLILHTDELLKIDGTQGSKLITGVAEEEEADYFGEELLESRRERNEKIFKDGGAHIKY